MRAKILNEVSLHMEKVGRACVDLASQNVHTSSYVVVREWITDLLLMYGLTVSLGNDTYLKSSLNTFTTFIKPQLDYTDKAEIIEDGLTHIIKTLSK